MSRKYLWSLYEGWSTDNDGNRYHIKDLIASNYKQVERYLKTQYDIEKMSDISDGNHDLIFEYMGCYSVSDHGNLIERTECEECEKSEENQCDRHFWQNDYIEAHRNDPITEEQYQKYTKPYYGDPIDLTT